MAQNVRSFTFAGSRSSVCSFVVALLGIAVFAVSVFVCLPVVICLSVRLCSLAIILPLLGVVKEMKIGKQSAFSRA